MYTNVGASIYMERNKMMIEKTNTKRLYMKYFIFLSIIRIAMTIGIYTITKIRNTKNGIMTDNTNIVCTYTSVLPYTNSSRWREQTASSSIPAHSIKTVYFLSLINPRSGDAHSRT